MRLATKEQLIERIQELEGDGQCHKCGGVSGVYYDMCDDCMTRFNKIDKNVELVVDTINDIFRQIETLHSGNAIHRRGNMMMLCTNLLEKLDGRKER